MITQKVCRFVYLQNYEKKFAKECITQFSRPTGSQTA